MADNATITQGTVATYTGSFQVLLTSPVQPVRAFSRLQFWPSGDTGELEGPPFAILRGSGSGGSTVATLSLGSPSTIFDLTPSSQYTVLIEGSAGGGPGIGTLIVEQLSS